jgi:MEDS: MEthanogen/methylotroph, DcmR Sensory domain
MTSFDMDPQTARILANPSDSHIVYSYADDRRLADAASFYTNNGLVRGNAVVLVVTDAHRRAIKKYLRADFDVDALEASGQLVFHEATAALNAFMVDGNPDPALVKAGIKKHIERARRDERTGRTREVRLFGEVVSLLWPANCAAAEYVEKLVHEVTQEYSVPLLCAYSIRGAGRGQLPESLISAHSHAIRW